MSRQLKINRSGMTTIDKVLMARHYPEKVSDYQAKMMLHALGCDNRPYRTYKGMKSYHACRNYYDAGGHDAELWDDLVSKGYATKRVTYHVTVKGIRVLEYLTQCRIWDNYLNEADCHFTILVELMKDDVYCGYGCWFPTSSRDLSLRLAIPQKLVLKTLHHLEMEGLAMKGHCGGQDDDGWVHCKHGWYLTKYAEEKYAEKYAELKKAEYKRLNDSLRDVVTARGEDDEAD